MTDICPECGRNLAADIPHHRECLTGDLERIEALSKRVRELIVEGCPHPFTETLEQLAALMRRATRKAEDTIALDRGSGVGDHDP